jgi:2-dehydropantoate 2-reductase
MRFIVYGAGAIGGVIGGRLFEAGHDVILVARGAHYQALAAGGLRLESPGAAVTLPVPVVSAPADIAFRDGDVVLLTMKSQHTVPALLDLAAVAPPAIPVVCAQNGIDNERAALRLYSQVYGMCVMCPTTHLAPGVVQAESTPVTGLLDLGRWPSGTDDIAETVAKALESATFQSVARADIARWKWGKLLLNLGNAVQALLGPGSGGDIAGRARTEAIACLTAAGIPFVGREEDLARRGSLLNSQPVGSSPRSGGSSWQSLARSAGSIETDYLNGEIVLLGRLHGIPAPVNETLQRFAAQAARDHRAPGSLSEHDLQAAIAAAAQLAAPQCPGAVPGGSTSNP